MIGEATGHRRSTWLSPVFLFGEFLMHETEIVCTAKQIHASAQGLHTGSGMPTFAREAGQSFAKGAIQPLDLQNTSNSGKIDWMAPVALSV